MRHFPRPSEIATPGHTVAPGLKAITYSEYGNPDVLEYGGQPMPKVGPGMVLVKVKAAAVNPVDWKTMAGDLDRFGQEVDGRGGHHGHAHKVVGDGHDVAVSSISAAMMNGAVPPKITTATL